MVLFVLLTGSEYVVNIVQLSSEQAQIWSKQTLRLMVSDEEKTGWFRDIRILWCISSNVQQGRYIVLVLEYWKTMSFYFYLFFFSLQKWSSALIVWSKGIFYRKYVRTMQKLCINWCLLKELSSNNKCVEILNSLVISFFFIF